MNLPQAERLAADLLARLMPACDDGMVCGSVRRQKPEVKDLELVIIPKTEPILDLFGEQVGVSRPIDALLTGLAVQRRLILNPNHKANGEKYKALWLPADGIAVDLFLADADNYGCLVAIRTGDQDFSHRMVMQRRDGGLMPFDMWQRDGYLWRMAINGVPVRLRVPTEAAYFAALGIDRPPHPSERNRETANRWSRQAAVR